VVATMGSRTQHEEDRRDAEPEALSAPKPGTSTAKMSQVISSCKEEKFFV
jgi:hypothetical protein